MKFIEDTDTSYVYAGTWVDDDPDVELFRIEVTEYSGDGLLEVDYYDCQTPSESWYSYVVLDEYLGENVGVLDNDCNYYGVISYGGGNKVENILLGIYDAIELWWNNITVWGFNR